MRVLRFLGVGLATALLDNGIFIAVHRATGVRFLSLSAATLVSVAFNYLVVRAFVFDASVEHSKALPKYLGLHAAGLLTRYAILEAIVAALHLGPKSLLIYGAKLVADGVVYSLKFLIQRDFVFRADVPRPALPKPEGHGQFSSSSCQPIPGQVLTQGPNSLAAERCRR